MFVPVNFLRQLKQGRFADLRRAAMHPWMLEWVLYFRGGGFCDDFNNNNNNGDDKDDGSVTHLGCLASLGRDEYIRLPHT